MWAHEVGVVDWWWRWSGGSGGSGGGVVASGRWWRVTARRGAGARGCAPRPVTSSCGSASSGHDPSWK